MMFCVDDVQLTVTQHSSALINHTRIFTCQSINHSVKALPLPVNKIFSFKFFLLILLGNNVNNVRVFLMQMRFVCDCANLSNVAYRSSLAVGKWPSFPSHLSTLSILISLIGTVFSAPLMSPVINNPIPSTLNAPRIIAARLFLPL